MTEDQAELLLHARDSLKAAEVLVREGYPGFAAFGEKFAHAGRVRV